MAITAYSGNLTGGSATKGAYVQIVASTPSASSRVYLNLGSTGTGFRTFLVDLATGASGSETVVVANLAVAADVDFLIGAWIPLDLDLPAGTRLAIRAQSNTGAISASWSLYLVDRALASLATPVNYGAQLALTRGSVVDPGGTINTKGVYTQLTASTTSRIDALVVCVTITAAASITAFTEWYLDLATGAAGSEVVVVPDLHCVANTTAACVRPGIMALTLAVPVSTRLAARCQCSRNTTTQRELAVSVIGLQQPATSGGGATSVAYLG